MKVVVLAGGRGTRLVEATARGHKALVEIGGRPILWHVLRIYAHHGFDDFLVAAGYRGQRIRRWFETAPTALVPWSVEVVDTGLETATGGRLGRLADRLGDATFMMTWCDGLADLDVGALLAFHRQRGRTATVTAVHPPPRFGHLELDGDLVVRFDEKPRRANEWINGAFFVLEPEALDHVEGDATDWDRDCLTRLAANGDLAAYRHESFWQCMDTTGELALLDRLWSEGRAPWRMWSE